MKTGSFAPGHFRCCLNRFLCFEHELLDQFSILWENLWLSMLWERVSVLRKQFLFSCARWQFCCCWTVSRPIRTFLWSGTFSVQCEPSSRLWDVFPMLWENCCAVEPFPTLWERFHVLLDTFCVVWTVFCVLRKGFRTVSNFMGKLATLFAVKTSSNAMQTVSIACSLRTAAFCFLRRFHWCFRQFSVLRWFLTCSVKL